jgi:hypothetical protein
MSLTTGQRISQNRWTELPMPQDIVDQITHLGQQQHIDEGIKFQDRDQQNVGDQGDELSERGNNDYHSVIEIDHDDKI